MRRLLAFVLEQRLLVFALTGLLVAVGAWSALRLPIDAVPDVTNVQVQINTNAPALSPLGQMVYTLAVDGEGRPFRDASGRLLLRPAGHGALIGNLEASGGDLVLLKNIDNVAAAPWKGPTYLWTRALLGRMREQARGPAPVRVCGMVPNTGEPGGGPFWVDGRRQIVESAQRLFHRLGHAGLLFETERIAAGPDQPVQDQLNGRPREGYENPLPPPPYVAGWDRQPAEAVQDDVPVGAEQLPHPNVAKLMKEDGKKHAGHPDQQE